MIQLTLSYFHEVKLRHYVFLQQMLPFCRKDMSPPYSSYCNVQTLYPQDLPQITFTLESHKGVKQPAQ